MNFGCKKCGSEKIHIEEKGTQIGLYCSDCGGWIKWLGKDERRLAELQIKKNNELDKISNKDVNLSNKILDFVTKKEEHYYNLAFKCMEDNNIDGNKEMLLQAGSFQRVRYYIEELLEENK